MLASSIMNSRKIKWVWSHRRKMSVHFLDIFVSGLTVNGFLPALDYVQKNQLVLILPGGDTYLFDDPQELEKLEKSILKQVQRKSFAPDLFRRNNELFGSLLLLSGDIRRSNLPLYENDRLISLYDIFIASIAQAPLIRVQLTGIDACWSDFSPLSRQLKAQARDEEKYKEWVNVLSHFSGESVAKSEEMDFLLLIDKIWRCADIKAQLKQGKIKAAFRIIRTKHPEIEAWLSSHMLKYEWVSSEYAGESWDIIRWLGEVSRFLDTDPRKRIRSLKQDENNKTEAKAKLLKKLQLDDAAMNVVAALDCFSTIRDWSKGYFVRALLDYRFLLVEIARRCGISFDDLLLFDIAEVRSIFRTGRYDKQELKRRNAGSVAIRLMDGRKETYSRPPDMKQIMDEDAVKKILSDLDRTKEFRGRTCYPGLVSGRAKVILHSRDIKRVEKGDVLVTYMTTMEFTPVFKKIAALVTDEGGISSHAAIISREFKIPCIVGTQVATRMIKNGDRIEVDANQGIVRLK